MFWRLLLAHVITDFLLQTKNAVGNKTCFKANLLHGFILLIVSSLVFIDLLDLKILLMLVSISVVHSIIDFFKSTIDSTLNVKWSWFIFLADQALHLLSIFALLSLFYPMKSIGLLDQLFSLTVGINWLKFFVFLILITAGGSYFTASLCKRFTAKLDQQDSLENAGQYIGILERIIIAASILIGRFEIIGFLIAAKSIIRHNETKEKAFTEYYLIGTLTSFIWAGIFTYLYLIII